MPYNILIVDDEPEILDALIDVLRKQPYRVFRAGSGKEALEVIGHVKVDVIVCDEQMPGIKGSDVMTWVYRTHPNIVRIILTGKVNLKSAIDAIHDGHIYKYLHKPCRSKDLINAINYGILEQSLLMEGENPWVEMSSSEQADLMAMLSTRQGK